MRYLGNKKKLLSEIELLLKKNDLIKKDYIFCDAFCGTGTVADYFKDKYKVIINDNLYVSHVMARGKLSNDIFFEGLGFDPFVFFNERCFLKKGFVYENYSPTIGKRMYFSDHNAMRIDHIRNKIEKWFEANKISEEEYFYLLASLIESVSRVSNVAGVYGAYLKKWDPRALKEMVFIPIDRFEKKAIHKNEFHNDDIEKIINNISGDILYLDPPYTNNHYHIQYHVLETIARYDKPQLKGITGSRTNWDITYNFSKKQSVHISFERLIANSNFQHIVISYSSKGIMSKEYIENVLKRYGIPETYSFKKINYKKYLNSKTNSNDENYEYLFYIKKKLKNEVIYNSPLNYIGGKGSMISFIKRHLPNNIDTFIDIFGGGFNVGINVDANRIIYNDINFKVVELIDMFSKEDTINIIKYIEKTIKKYSLEKNDKEQYIKVRTLYNDSKVKNIKLLYVLILFGFQQQIRFNSSYEFNNPVGQSSYNDNILEKIISFSRIIKEKKVIIKSSDYLSFENEISKDTFFYFDPPYLITLGSYNDGKRGFNGWNEIDEKKLLCFLEKINNAKGKFMLSNVLVHKDKENHLLKEWLSKNKNKNINVIEFEGKSRNREEVIIKNY